MNLTTWEMFKVNASLLWHKATFWVVTIWGLGKIYWDTMMTAQDHQAFYDLLPYGLGKFVPFVLFAVSYFVANGWPQPALAEKKAEKVASAIGDKLASQ